MVKILSENKSPKGFMNTCGIFLFLITVLISLTAWITYGTLEDVLGTLAYSIIGILNFFPWIIPFIGIPLGILDVLNVYGFGMYDLTLNIAHQLESLGKVLRR